MLQDRDGSLCLVNGRRSRANAEKRDIRGSLSCFQHEFDIRYCTDSQIFRSGVLMWIGILSAAFVVMGYAFLGLDRILKRKNA